MTTDINLLVNG